jgi:hypothetical protein
MDPELTQAQLAQARKEVKAARAKGFSDDDIGAYLKEEYGVGLDALQPKGRDYGRAVGQGLAAGFLDDLRGLAEILPTRGNLGRNVNDYREARNEVRDNLSGARAIAPKRMLAAEVGGGLLGAIPAMGASAVGQGGGALAKMANAGEAGFGFGLLSGAGHSEATSPVGVIDEAGMSGLLTAAGGSLLSGAGSAIGALRPTTKILNEVAALAPDDLASRIARQESLAPGTATIAGQSSKVADFAASLVGGDKYAARRAVGEVSEGIKMLDRARSAVGKRYEPHHGKMLPVTDDLRQLVGDKVKLGDEVDFKILHDLRSDIGSELGKARKAAVMGNRDAEREAHALGELYTGLNNWLHPRVEGLATIDNDYGAIKQMIANARNAQKLTDRAQVSGAKARGRGKPSAQMQQPSLTSLLTKYLPPYPGQRARIVEKMLMRPENTQRTLSLLQGGEMFPGLQMGLVSGGAQLPPYLVER